MVQVNSKGALYFLDGGERRIVGLSATGEDLGAVDPRGLPSSAEVVPKSFRIDRDDNIYILDIFSAQVLVLDAEGQYSRHVPFPEEYGFFSDLAVDRQGTIFLLDSVEAVVYSTAGAADGFSPLTKSMKEYVNFPTGLAMDDQGVLYLVDQYGSGLALVGEDGSFLGRRLGMGWNESGLHFPSQICISENGNVFIADRDNSRVQVFTVGKE
jgi:sugar lactone lactonase YvrE